MISKVAWIIFGGGLGTIIGIFGGLWLGMFLGGNFFNDVSWLGMVGYELFGTIGIIVGAILGFSIGVNIVLKRLSVTNVA